MNWYAITYYDEYSQQHSHTFSGNVGTLRMVLSARGIDVDLVTDFTMNDKPVDLKHYLGEKEYKVGDKLEFTDLHWYSDYNGYEVGYDDVLVVGLYAIKGTDYECYINSEDGTILELWEVEAE